MTLKVLACASLVLSLTACSNDDSDTPNPPGAAAASVVPADDPCQRGTLEADSMLSGPFQGPGVDPESGELLPAPAGAVASTTYLRLRPDAEAQQLFGELAQGIGQALATQEGLLAVQFASSDSCGTARTLSLWQDEEAMFAFVASPAHAAAMSAVGEVSRGGSITTHWSAAGSETTWAKATQELAVSTRREY